MIISDLRARILCPRKLGVSLGMNLEQAKAQDVILNHMNKEDSNLVWDISELSIKLNIEYDLCYVACEEIGYVRDHAEIQDGRPISKYPNDKSIFILPAGNVFAKSKNSYESEFLSELSEYDQAKTKQVEEGEKLKAETRLIKLQLKMFWPLVITALFGWVIGVISLLAQVGYIHLPQQKEIQTEQAQDTTSVLLQPKKVDSMPKQ